MSRKNFVSSRSANRKLKTVALFSTLLLSVTACTQPTTNLDSVETQELDVSDEFLLLAQAHSERILGVSPEWATQLGVDESIGGKQFNHRLSRVGPKENSRQIALNDVLRQELGTVDRSLLEGQALITYDIMQESYELAGRQNRFGYGVASLLGAATPYAVNQLYGPHVDLPRLFSGQHRIASSGEMTAYIARLSQYDDVLDGVVTLLRQDAKRGVIPPAFALEAVENYAIKFAEIALEEQTMYVFFNESVDRLDDVPREEKVTAKQKVRHVIEREVYPAYLRLAQAARSLVPDAGTDAGLWRLKDGAELYQVALDNYGANGMTAEDIHMLGLSDVARIQASMDKILKGLGYATGSVADRLVEIANRPGGLAPNTEAAKAELLEELESYVNGVLRIAPEWFGTIPPQELRVKRIPSYEEDSAAPAYYLPPALDGSRPGVFYINLKDTKDWPLYQLKSLVYHEAVPGHHFQASLQQASDDMPLIRNMVYFYEYGEGWALYAEALAEEMGLYEKDPLGNLGRLKLELYRAARLVVDTGIHHKRWSREYAIDWMVGVTGETRASIEREIERYAVWPGQATSYKLGMIQFQQLRARIEDLLGSKFDIGDFHDQLLIDGSMPLPVLVRKIESWAIDQL